MNKALLYLFYSSIILIALSLASHVYSFIIQIHGEHFMLTANRFKYWLEISILLFTLLSVCFSLTVIIIVRILRKTTFPIRLYCDLCALLAITWTVVQFTKEFADKYYYLNLDFSNLSVGLMGVAIFYGFIFLTVPFKPKESVN